MQVLSPEEVRAPDDGMALTIGAYDGVHLGHRGLLAILRGRADALGVPAAVVTFDRHPATVIRPGSAPVLLTDTEQKLELLASCGVDLTVVVPFDERRANESAEDFVDEVLVGALGVRLVVVGENFHFGRARAGNVALLRELGSAKGFGVVGVPLTAQGAQGAGAVVSSTRVRGLLAEGDVAGAAVLLDRPHEVRGTVVHGDGRGAAQLGMPTANVEIPDGIALPALGVYAGVVRRADGSSHAAAISVGVRPTFYDGDASPGSRRAPLVEAYLLDFEGDLYGERVAVAFVDRLRDERKFERLADLVAQMWADVAQTRAIVVRPG